MPQPARSALKLRRTNVHNRRPSPSVLFEGELAVNYSSSTPGVFFKDSDENLVKVGVAQVSDQAPSPAENIPVSVGELWYDTAAEKLMVWVGTEWKPAVPSPISDPQPRVQTIVFLNTDGTSTEFVG